ncbi:unnamed protein product, partial [Ectocarpus sp. 8 AP-2014]
MNQKLVRILAFREEGGNGMVIRLVPTAWSCSFLRHSSFGQARIRTVAFTLLLFAARGEGKGGDEARGHTRMVHTRYKMRRESGTTKMRESCPRLGACLILSVRHVHTTTIGFLQRKRDHPSPLSLTAVPDFPQQATTTQQRPHEVKPLV